MTVLFILIRIFGLIMFGFNAAHGYNLDYIPPFVAAFIVIVAYWFIDVDDEGGLIGHDMVILRPGQIIKGGNTND